MNPNLEKAIEFLDSDYWKNIPSGKTHIDGLRLYALRSAYMTKMRSECHYESHRLYVDIQMVIKGNEIILSCIRDGLKIVEPYSEEKDVDFLEGEPNPVHTIILGYPMIAVFFPWDVHMPSLTLGDNSIEVEKIVLKVAL